MWKGVPGLRRLKRAFLVGIPLVDRTLLQPQVASSDAHMVADRFPQLARQDFEFDLPRMREWSQA